MFDTIVLFTQIVEENSFSKASEKLGIPPSTLSRKIKELESYLNTTLIIRDTRNMGLTEHGQLLYSQFKDLRHDLDSIYKIINQIKNEEACELNVSLPIHMSLNLITPYLNYFIDNHPNIKLNCLFQETELDIENRKLDIIVTYDKIYHKHYTSRLARKEYAYLYCTPQYIEKYGAPITIADLENHNFIGVIDFITKETIQYFKFTDMNTNEVYIFDNIKNSQLRIDNGNHILQLGLAGEHIFGSWNYVCDDLEKQGKLVKLLPNYYTYEHEHCIYSRKKLRKVDNDFIEFIQRCMNGNIKQDILNI